MSRFFTSDWHFGHENINTLAQRGFKDVNHMNETLIERHNEIVGWNDDVYVLGDAFMGIFDQSIRIASRLHGRHILVEGNHDFPRKESRRALYERAFVGITDQTTLRIADRWVLLSHFPYAGDSHGEDRYRERRPEDKGVPLLHGHTHSKDTISSSPANTLQIHVGVDAHAFYPISEEMVAFFIQDAYRDYP